LLAPPFLYIITLVSCEKYLDKTYSNQIQNILIGESERLLDGSVRLEEQIANNIQAFIKNDRLIQSLKLDINIIVTTIHGKIIYPVYLNVNTLINEITDEFDSETIAKNNFDVLNQGLDIKIETNLGHGSNIGNIILILYFGISSFILLGFYKIGSSKALMEHEKRAQLISDLKKEEETHKLILNDLQRERKGLFENIKSLNIKYQEDKNKAKVNEDEMFEEIISLEEKLNSSVELKQNKEMEIAELRSKIEKFERRRGSKTKRLEFDFITKRFYVLYKNIIMNRKAIAGFLSLGDEQQIKAEEIIHLMDRNPDKITIKRKVFSGKKHRTACFEVLFAYNGRLYFKKNETNMVEILIIGTKNSQTKDMEFLHNL